MCHPHGWWYQCSCRSCNSWTSYRKVYKDKNGKITKVNAIPGHNITIGALGVFILWLGWYGFNGAAAKSVEQLGSIFVTTTIAPALATVVCMISHGSNMASLMCQCA